MPTISDQLTAANIPFTVQNLATIANLEKRYKKNGFNVTSTTIVNFLISNFKQGEPNLKSLFSELHKMKLAPIKKTEKLGRNSPCPCGSGKKYKKCYLKK